MIGDMPPQASARGWQRSGPNVRLARRPEVQRHDAVATPNRYHFGGVQVS